MTIQELTEKEAKNRAKEYATPLDGLIKPKWEFDTKEWENVDRYELEDEIHFSIDIMMSEINSHYQLKDILYTHALTELKNNLTRVPKDHVTFDDKKEALSNGYWYYGMDKFECFELLQEIYTTLSDIPSEYYEYARMNVQEGLFEGSWPSEVEL